MARIVFLSALQTPDVDISVLRDYLVKVADT